MSELLRNIQETRRALVEARINLRHAEMELAEAEAAFVASVDYASLGSNEKTREYALAGLKQNNAELARLRTIRNRTQDEADRKQVELECYLDERRQRENHTWARLADYLLAQEEVRHASLQAARCTAQDTLIEEVTRNIQRFNDQINETANLLGVQRPKMDFANEDDIPF